MVQRVQYMLVDDIDGTEAVETVSFSFDGVSYEIDLPRPMPRSCATTSPRGWAMLVVPAAERARARRGLLLVRVVAT